MIKMANFDYEKELNDYKCPQMFKAGLKYYFKSNDLKPKSKKEFDKIVNDYKNLKMGE